MMLRLSSISFVFFFNDTATTEIYTLSLHDALPIFGHDLHVRGVEAQLGHDLSVREVQAHEVQAQHPHPQRLVMPGQDRKSTRLNSSHANISYAVFCLKKKKKEHTY